VSRRTADKKLIKLHVLTITKAFTNTTNCTCRAKKVDGHDNKNVFGTLYHTCAPKISNSFWHHCMGLQ